ncbi:hypothetical protein DRQ09_08955, partial [candidate division KSB1 bacterium]
MRKKIFDFLSKWAVEHPLRTITVFGLISVVCLVIGAKLRITTRWSDLLPQKDPSVQEFNRIIEQYESASSIIIVIKGEENKIKSFADEIAEPISALKNIKHVVYKINTDFFRNHGFMLMRTKDLKNFADIFNNLNLEPMLKGINNNLEKTYVYSEDEERLSTKQKTDEAIMLIESIKFWL